MFGKKNIEKRDKLVKEILDEAVKHFHYSEINKPECWSDAYSSGLSFSASEVQKAVEIAVEKLAFSPPSPEPKKHNKVD